MAKININKLTPTQQMHLQFYKLYEAGVEREKMLAELNISKASYYRLTQLDCKDLDAMIATVEGISKERTAEILEIYFKCDILANSLPFRFGMTKETWFCFITQHVTPQKIKARNIEAARLNKRQYDIDAKRERDEQKTNELKINKDWGNADFSDNEQGTERHVIWRQQQSKLQRLDA